jgi:CRP/FNR family transcriptional regulator, cyclic AMP receptor protein
MDIDTLRTVSFLRDLTDDELESFAALLTIREAKNGERLLEEGTIVNHLYIVCEGVVHVRRLAQTREILLNRLGVNAFFGEINLFDPGTATASIYAMKNPTRLAVVDYQSLREFLSTHTATGYKIVSAMMTETVRRLRQTSARLVNSVYWSSSEATKDLKKPT